MTGPHVVVAGGGLAGLSLAVALLDRRPELPITVLEPRTRYADDRTWCFWDIAPHPFRELIAERWDAWSVTGPGGTAVLRDPATPYARLRARDVYHHALARLASAPNALLRTGMRVTAVARDHVTTAHGETIAGDVLADARPPEAADWARTEHPWLWQVFAGARVHAAPGTFDPGTVELMDFGVEQAGEIRFRYVVPRSDTEALVELTAFSTRGPDPAPVAAALDGALSARVRDADVGAREQGCIPMTSAPPPLPAARGVIPLGTRAGAPRPSTGYAFLPIQRHSAAVADAIVAGRPGARPMRSARARALDRVFLNRLAADPAGAPELLHRMAARVPAGVFARFLMERGSPWDTLRVMAALPTLPFAWEGLRGLARARTPHPVEP